MIRIAAILLAAAASTASASPEDVVARLRAVSGFTGPVRVIHAREINAWYRFGMVDLSDKLVAKASPDELAFIIGHEMAHASIDNSHGSASELAADIKGAEYARRAGYDPTAGADFLKRIDVVWRGDIAHPPAWCRADAIRASVLAHE